MILDDELREFIALCESGRTAEAIERFYADEAIVFENHERARVGKAACLAYEREAAARDVRPPTIKARGSAIDPSTGKAFVEWTIRFLGDDGRPMLLEEVAVQRWSRGKIVEERFYYEGVVDEGDPQPIASEAMAADQPRGG